MAFLSLANFFKRPNVIPTGSAPLHSLLGTKPAINSAVNKPLREEGAHHVPVYPPIDPGVPFVSVDDVVASQHDLIEKIMKGATLDAESHVFVPELIRNFAAYVHLLPATRAEQYPGNGGLFRMGLEVGFHALRASHGVIFAREIAETRVRSVPRWRIATLVAGLLADTYRAVTSMQVITEQGAQWNPFTQSLSGFLQTVEGQRYFIKWTKDAKDTPAFNNLVVGDVVPQSLLAYLAETGPNIVGAMLEAIAGTGTSPLALTVHKVRKNLIQRDVQANPNFVGRPMLGSHLEANIIDSMRRLVREDKWRCNQTGQPLWHGPDGLFLVIGAGWKDLYSAMQSTGFKGIPTDFSVIAETLLKAGIVMPASTGGYVYEIKIPAFERKALEAVKLTSGTKAFGDAYTGFAKTTEPLMVGQNDVTEAQPSTLQKPTLPEPVRTIPPVAPKPAQDQMAEVATIRAVAVEKPTPPIAPPRVVPVRQARVPVIEHYAPVDLPPGMIPKDVSGEPANDLPNVGELVASLSAEDTALDDFEVHVKTALGATEGKSTNAAATGALNPAAWGRYAAKMSPTVAQWIQTSLKGISDGSLTHVVRDDALGVRASSIDEAGLSRGAVLTVMVRDGLIWIPPDQNKKIVDIDGEAHVFFNRRFLSEVLS